VFGLCVRGQALQIKTVGAVCDDSSPTTTERYPYAKRG
jgi:hypothetical protein